MSSSNENGLQSILHLAGKQ